MYDLKPFFFTLKVLLVLLSLLTLKPLVDANTRKLIDFNIQQVTLNTNNNSFAYESDDEDIINRTPLTIESEIIAEEFRYLMKFRVKTYKDYKDTYAIPDTGSDLTWLQNRICNDEKKEHCYDDLDAGEWREKPKDIIGCEDHDCGELMPESLHLKKCTKEKKCGYSIGYEDRSKSEGILGRAEFSFTATGGTKTSFEQQTTIGFSKKLAGEDKSSKNLYQGVVGLGHGPPSLIKQYRITAAFSYYLPQFRRKDEEAIKARSKFRYGDDVKISDKNTPLLPKNNGDDDECDIRYCVHLKGISLKFEDENHELRTNTPNKTMIIDSGSTFTYLTSDIFKDFVGNISKKLNVEEPTSFKNYDNCFEKNDENEKKLKKISFEFSGTKIELKRENFLDDFTTPTESNEDQKHYICLTVQEEKKRKYHILGSRAQMDFLVAFNLRGNKLVSFDHLEDKHIEESLVLSE